MRVDVVEHALDAQPVGGGDLPPVGAAAGDRPDAPSVESSASTCMRRKSRSGGESAGSASTSGRAARAASFREGDAAPGALQHRRDRAHLGERAGDVLRPRLGEPHDQRDVRVRGVEPLAEHQVCGRFGPSSTRSPSS